MHALKPPRTPHAVAVQPNSLTHTPPSSSLLPESRQGLEYTSEGEGEIRSMEAAAAPQHGGANGVIDLDEAGSGSGGGAPLSPPLSPASAAAAALANARWNPTKEQLAALEGLYEHGLRTPTAEQIKQITARLREHGHIEGKNVFYWFQNHKARQRQKLKQDNFAYFTRLLRRPPPLPVLVRPPGPLPPPYPHGRLPVPATPSSLAVATPPPAAAAAAAAACSNTSGGMHVMYRAPAFYMPAPPQAPAPNALYYHHHPQQQQQQVQAPVMYPRMEVAQDQMIQAAAQHNHHHHRRRRHHNPAAGAMYHAAAAGSSASTAPMHVLHFPPAAAAATDAGPSRETLQLFPLQPTFLLPADKSMASTTASASFSGESESMEESPDSSGEALAVPFYDFFGLHSGGR